MRYGAIQALRSLGDERAVEPLIRICLENEDLRPYALEAIRELCGDDSTEPVLRPSVRYKRLYLRPPTVSLLYEEKSQRG